MIETTHTEVNSPSQQLTGPDKFHRVEAVQQNIFNINGLALAGAIYDTAYGLDNKVIPYSGTDQQALSSRLKKISRNLALKHDPNHPLNYDELRTNPEQYNLTPVDLLLVEKWLTLLSTAQQQKTYESSLEYNLHDSLTGLQTRKGLEYTLKKALAIAEKARQQNLTPRSNEPIVTPAILCDGGMALMLDLDKFKFFNDSYSYAVGDQILAILGDVITRVTRSDDVLVRFGGEELVIFMSGSTQKDVEIIFERLRGAFAKAQDQSNIISGLNVTFSGGACEYTQDDIENLAQSSGKIFTETLNSILQGASEGIHESKRNGRNQLTITPPPSPTPSSPLHN